MIRYSSPGACWLTGSAGIMQEVVLPRRRCILDKAQHSRSWKCSIGRKWLSGDTCAQTSPIMRANRVKTSAMQLARERSLDQIYKCSKRNKGSHVICQVNGADCHVVVKGAGGSAARASHVQDARMALAALVKAFFAPLFPQCTNFGHVLRDTGKLGHFVSVRSRSCFLAKPRTLDVADVFLRLSMAKQGSDAVERGRGRMYVDSLCCCGMAVADVKARRAATLRALYRKARLPGCSHILGDISSERTTDFQTAVLESVAANCSRCTQSTHHILQFVTACGGARSISRTARLCNPSATPLWTRPSGANCKHVFGSREIQPMRFRSMSEAFVSWAFLWWNFFRACGNCQAIRGPRCRANTV